MDDSSICFEQNHLLAALPKSAQARIFPRLKLVNMNLGDVVYESHATNKFVYFPTNCIVSLLCVMLDGSSTEISLVGREGVVGFPIFMGSESTPSRTVVQSKGSAYRMNASEFKVEFDNYAEVRLLILRYAQALITQISQTAACYRHQTIDEQLCCLLLFCLDRHQSNQLKMTQDLIGNTLGVRRESVTEAANKLQNRGIIKYSRGQITVLDRPELEALCCECYAVVKLETDRLVSGDLRL